MVSIMKSLNAFDELINEVSMNKVTFAAKACIKRLEDATDELRRFFNENPGDRLALQQKYNTANTYALQVEYFLCMSDSECNRRYKERQNAKTLYELARQLLYGYAEEGKPKDTRDYFLLVDYASVAQKYYIATENFLIDLTPEMMRKVEEMSKYIVQLTRNMNGITVEEYNARNAEACKNEEVKGQETDNNETKESSENSYTGEQPVVEDTAKESSDDVDINGSERGVLRQNDF